MDVAENVTTDKSPQELLGQAGYNLYKCETGDDVAKFKKYYASDEMLCTFKDGKNGEHRLETNTVFWAVSKDIDQIKRPKTPRREDDYGVSVISIQINKSSNHLSIKNRYNHAVTNPDATFGNNLDNIIPGLTDAFNREYGLSIDANQASLLDLGNYIRASDGKFYRFNAEHNNIYYCPNNIIIDNGEVKKFDKSKFILMDTFILSKENPPTIKPYDTKLENTFMSNDDIKGRKIAEEKSKDEYGEEIAIVTLKPADAGMSDIIIILDKNNNIIGYENQDVTQIGDDFLKLNTRLREVYLPKAETIGNDFLCGDNCVKRLLLMRTTKIGNGFMCGSSMMQELYSPELQTIGHECLQSNMRLRKLFAPKLEKVGDEFLRQNMDLQEPYLPNLQVFGSDILYIYRQSKELDVEQLFDILKCQGENNEKI